MFLTNFEKISYSVTRWCIALSLSFLTRTEKFTDLQEDFLCICSSLSTWLWMLAFYWLLCCVFMVSAGKMVIGWHYLDRYIKLFSFIHLMKNREESWWYFSIWTICLVCGILIVQFSPPFSQSDLQSMWSSSWGDRLIRQGLVKWHKPHCGFRCAGILI